jgi:diaminopimelate decarboxylase
VSVLDTQPTLTEEQIRSLQTKFGTPIYVYDENTLETQARRALDFPNPFGLTVRFAMKACPSAAVIRIFDRLGLHIDASSGFEARRAILAGIPADHILLTAQEVPAELESLVAEGVKFNACSLQQLATYGRAFPGGEVGVRFNPGLGSGHSNRTNVGGPSASFGIWHAHLDQVLAICESFDLRVRLLHSHIGSGSDPVIWQRCARLTLGIVKHLPDVTTVNLGGGFKVGRMADEVSTDLATAGEPVAAELERFGRESGRQLRLEIEPGTFLVTLAGSVICTSTDIVTTGKEGYSFIKVDTGMTELLRPSLYGAQHPIVVIPAVTEERGTGEYLVVGHCCESGDVLTPEPGNPDGLLPRTLTETKVGDALWIGGSGAYCASMSAKNYNSFPEAAEILVSRDGTFHEIRQRQTLDQIVANEIVPDDL